MAADGQSTKDSKFLTTKQDLVFCVFTALVSKQELGTVKAADVEQLMAVAEAAATRILAVK